MKELIATLIFAIVLIGLLVMGLTSFTQSDGIEILECQQRFEEITQSDVQILAHTQHRGLTGDDNDVWFDLIINEDRHQGHCVGHTGDRLVCYLFNWNNTD